MDCSIPGFPVHYQLPELTQTHVCRVGDAIQTSHPLSSLSPPAFNLSQHHVFSNETALRIRWPKYWSFSYCIRPPNKYSELISFWIDWFYPCSPRDSQESSRPQLESINSLSLSLICGLNLTSVSDYRKHYSFDYMDLGLQSDVSAF